MSILTAVTLIVAFVYGVVLLVTLVSVALSLVAASRSAGRLADGLELVAHSAEPVAERVRAINGGLTALRDGLAMIDKHLGDLARRTELG